MNYELVKIIENGSAKTFIYRPKDDVMPTVNIRWKQVARFAYIALIGFMLICSYAGSYNGIFLAILISYPFLAGYVFKELFDL